MKDCLQKVIAGQTLAGVQVRFETLSACQERWAAQNTPRTRRMARDADSNPNRRLTSDEKSSSRKSRSPLETTGFNDASSFAPRASQVQDATR